ncbi:hypothetical protein ASD46_24690 [Rhizobium sp. Root491]|uniref:helix-turn-helix domain-containing protein n=1 Tax=Agrobacterium tumefaciens TaxID=358 RepID=UPI0007129052|nr:AraC family transcriptional regulator [Agrobacterium tumefaciens]KQY49475.1 hypothetical protein ASD46_24690 [Rhizobium sp. Root491]NTA84437.1 helix-turn-helix transcriptional regulator [Agrobacterium tumefaciens]UXT84652.1 helix-turn-helix transcriptional regulator [Agrobacterium tumefaciens]
MLKGRSLSWGPQIVLNGAAVCYTRTGSNEINYIQNAHALVIHLSPDSGWNLAVNTDRKYTGAILPGAVDVIPCNSQVLGTWTGTIDGVRIDIDPMRLERLAGAELSNSSFELQPPQFGFIDKQLHTLALWMLKELDDGDALSPELLDALITVSYTHVLRNYSTLTGRKIPSGGLSPLALRKVRDFIHANKTRTLTTEELATVAALSPSHFIRAFKHSTGQTPHQYILNARLDEARKLILGRDLPLNQIATAVGFSSHSHMTSQMKRAWGITPSELRRPY